MTDGYLDGVGVVETVQFQSPAVCVCYELCPDVVLWEQVLDAEELDEGSVALVQPEMGPPFL